MPRRGLLDEIGLAQLASEQDRVVSGQLAWLGADRHVVRQRVATGRWTPSADGSSCWAPGS